MPAPTKVDRFAYALFSAMGLAVVVLARMLTPSASGQGTHVQLGLPPCAFHLFTGHACAGCGMTTSFAWMARGELAVAFEANPMGPFLFAMAALLVPVGAVLAFRPVSLDAVTQSRYFFGAVIGVLGTMLGVWAVRLWLGLA